MTFDEAKEQLRYDEFREHLKNARKIVSTWPDWKRTAPWDGAAAKKTNPEPTMSESVREAAERYRKHKELCDANWALDSPYADRERWCIDSIKRCRDEGILADFALSLLDPTPVDEAKAIELGGERHEGSHPYFILFCFHGSSALVWDTRNNSWTLAGGSRIWRESSPTVGQLRQLIEALTITTEPRK
jgi:hypothetical protein